MKKIILTLFLLFSVISVSNIININAEVSDDANQKEIMELNRAMANRIAELENEITELKRENLIKYIVVAAEIDVPKHINVIYIEYTFNLANELKIPTRTAFRLMYKESNFKDSVVSKVGAQGLMQLMPETRSKYYEMLRVDTLNLDRNQEDIYIGLNLIKDLYNFWYDRGNSVNTSWRLAIASYNAGKGSVLKYKGVPPFKETQDFVAFILKSHSNPQLFANYSKKYENTHKNNT
jgi:soluble lytic murein transglycosylase-like protein